MNNTWYFFVPGFGPQYRTGGLMVVQHLAELFEKTLGYSVDFVATHEKESTAMSMEELFSHTNTAEGYYLVTWGPLVQEHIKLITSRFRGIKILYYAQSFGWGVKVPYEVPIISVSRFVMSQWALHAPNNFCGYVPPALSPHFQLPPAENMRDIDIIVHERKQNGYCLKKLLPALHKKNLRIHHIKEWIDQAEFAALLKRAKVFLYCTELHRAGLFRKLPGEGFGLPALEAAASGATVASNLLGGVTDFLTPGENCIKIRGLIETDVEEIVNGVKNFKTPISRTEKIIDEYSSMRVAELWKSILSRIKFCS